MSGSFRIETVAQIHQLLGTRGPHHPLVSVITASWHPPVRAPPAMVNHRVESSLYAVSLKQGHACAVKHGRQRYDFQEGSVLFLAPGQVVTPLTEPGELEGPGVSWTVVFHPDLIRASPLAAQMRDFTFFSYDPREALHLSGPERERLTAVVKALEEECAGQVDAHTQQLLVTHLTLLLTHCKRAYARQFSLRSDASKDVIGRLESFLWRYFESGMPATHGPPTVRDCAREVGYSPDYLSDLLRRETGKNTREHIQHVLIERAKTRLLGSEDTVSQIAASLGFEHPQHFSRLFRTKTGKTPGAYRH